MRPKKMENTNLADSRSPRTRRLARFFRFRLRTFLLAFTIIGVFVGPELYRQKQQHNAAERLRSIPSTSLAYDYDLESVEQWKSKFPLIRSKVSGLFRRITGSQFLNPVVRLFLSDNSAESIALIGKLGHLKWLHISSSTGSLNDGQITSLEPIRKCSQLQYLVVGNWLVLSPSGSEGFRGTGTTLFPYDVTASDIQVISKLTKLRVLAIGGRHINDDSIQELAKLNSLQYLYLSNANVTLEGISEFRRQRSDVEVIELTDPSVDYSIEIGARF